MVHSTLTTSADLPANRPVGSLSATVAKSQPLPPRMPLIRRQPLSLAAAEPRQLATLQSPQELRYCQWSASAKHASSRTRSTPAPAQWRAARRNSGSESSASFEPFERGTQGAVIVPYRYYRERPLEVTWRHARSEAVHTAGVVYESSMNRVWRLTALHARGASITPARRGRVRHRRGSRRPAPPRCARVAA